MVGNFTSLVGTSSWLCLALTLAACSGDKSGDRNDDSTGGTKSSGGSTGTGGTSTGMSGGSGGGGSKNPYPCSPKVAPDTPEMTKTIAADGKWGGMGFSGGTFVYGDAAGSEAGSDVKMSFENASLNVKGNVGTYTGFGLWIGPAPTQTVACIDASKYEGVSFKVVDNSGTTTSLQVSIQAHADAPVDTQNKRGACVYLSETSKYSDCVYPSASAMVPASGGVVEVPFTDFKNGKPVATVDPSEIDGLQFQFPWADGMAAYDVDITITDLKFY